MPHPNEEMLRQAYGAFARGDLQGYLSNCTPGITFRVPGRCVVAGTYSRDQFASPMISTVIEQTQASFRETVLDVVANDQRGVVLASHEFARNGKMHKYNTAHIYRIEDGKLASFEEYPEDLYAFDDAWG
jgi:ketosteroid isomerase-like protein